MHAEIGGKAGVCFFFHPAFHLAGLLRFYLYAIFWGHGCYQVIDQPDLGEAALLFRAPGVHIVLRTCLQSKQPLLLGNINALLAVASVMAHDSRIALAVVIACGARCRVSQQ